MCRIGITLNKTTPQGTTITSAVGRYRIKNSGTNWITWNINLLDPKTPDITIVGLYEVEVNVTNSDNVTSEWGASTFTVSTTCGDVSAGTPSAFWSNGDTLNLGFGLPNTNPQTKVISGTVTITNGPMIFNVDVRNQYNNGNDFSGSLIINNTTIGASTISTSPYVISNGTITLQSGTYPYTLSGTLYVIGGYTGGAGTVKIINV